MKKQKSQRTKVKLWVIGAVVGLLVIGAVAFKLATTTRDKDVLGTTTVSVTVTCEGVCTELIGEVINDQNGQPILPDSSGEYNVTDPDVTIDTTVKGAAQLRITLTNSTFPAPTGTELFNEIFSSLDPAYGALGETFQILPGSGLASYLQLGRNVFDFYVTSSVNSPTQDIHRQIIINYTLPSQPPPEIIDTFLTNNSGNSLPYVHGTTDYVAKNSDLPLHVELEANNINRAQLTVTDSNGNTSTVYDGAPLPADPATGYATYEVWVASGSTPGLRIGRNVITLTVTGLNGQTLTVEWVVYYWPDGVEPPSTGVIQIGRLTIAVNDLLISSGIVAAFVLTAIIVIMKSRKDRKGKRQAQKKSKG